MPESVSERVKKIVPLLQKYALGDFSAQIEISDKNDEFDALAVGINMMIDDIRGGQENEHAINEELNASNEELKAANEELKANMEDMKNQQGLLMGREKRMIEIKKETNSLLWELGREEKYQNEHLCSTIDCGLFVQFIAGCVCLEQGPC